MELEDQELDNFVATHPHGSIYQSSLWFKYQVAIGNKPKYKTQYINKEIKQTFLFWRHGAFNLKLAWKYPIASNEFITNNLPTGAFVTSGETINQKTTGEYGTFIIKLGEEHYSKKCRKAIREGQEKLEIRESAYDFSYLINQSKGINEYEKAIIGKKVLQNHIKHFVAYKNNKLVGCLGGLRFGDWAGEFGAVVTKEGRQDFVGEVLKDYCLKWALLNRCKRFDLAGVKLKNRTEKEENIYRFKEKFGGELINLEVYRGLSAFIKVGL